MLIERSVNNMGFIFPNEKVIEVVKDYVSGLDADEVSKKHGITPETIRTWVKKAGFTLRPARSVSRNWEDIKKLMKK